ncbi:MAG: site-specific integrase [Clostridiales bacterium]|nr:site-specific integrase [Clostridiales bacterium]
MPAYKDELQNTWYCQFYYEDWQGNKKKKKKRGFKTKKEALEWESNYKLSANANMDMTVGAFVEVYFRDKAGELKERSTKNKRYMIEAHVLPYFENKPMNSITPSDIIQWQNEIRAKGFSQTYLRMIQNQITALFTHASNIYNLANNPCKKVKRMGKADADKLEFWTKEEYDNFISGMAVGSKYYVIFEILFWTGCREGELLALTKSDIDFFANKISITKTYYRTEKRDVITTPKTEQSVRIIDIPQFLTQEIKEYVDKLYELPNDERIFPMVAEAVQHKLKRECEKSGVKKIRVHDIRHSHVAYLINQGVQPLMIKERLGHRDIKITLNTYGHLYPNQQRQLADMLNQQKAEKSPNSGNCQDLR